MESQRARIEGGDKVLREEEDQLKAMMMRKKSRFSAGRRGAGVRLGGHLSEQGAAGCDHYWMSVWESGVNQVEDDSVDNFLVVDSADG